MMCAGPSARPHDPVQLTRLDLGPLNGDLGLFTNAALAGSSHPFAALQRPPLQAHRTGRDWPSRWHRALPRPGQFPVGVQRHDWPIVLHCALRTLASISALASEEALAALCARSRTSTATTAEPLPASLARSLQPKC